MDNRLARIEDKLDKVVEKIGSIDVTMARNTEQLAEHMRRTELLEEEVKPISTHVANLKGVTKLLAILALLAGVIEGAVALLEHVSR